MRTLFISPLKSGSTQYELVCEWCQYAESPNIHHSPKFSMRSLILESRNRDLSLPLSGTGPKISIVSAKTLSTVWCFKPWMDNNHHKTSLDIIGQDPGPSPNGPPPGRSVRAITMDESEFFDSKIGRWSLQNSITLLPLYQLMEIIINMFNEIITRPTLVTWVTTKRLRHQVYWHQ